MQSICNTQNKEYIEQNNEEMGNPQEPTVQRRELYSVLCGDLNEKEIQKEGIYVYI